MSDEMAERTVIPVPSARAVLAARLRAAAELFGRALEAGDIVDRLAWATVMAQLTLLCGELGLGRPGLREDGTIEWEG